MVIDSTLELPGNIAGYTDGKTVWLCRTLTQAQTRCVLEHELVHIERGLIPGHSPEHEREERIVDEVAARRLVPISQLIEALRWTRGRPDRECAWELFVDCHTLTVRVQTLTEAERRQIDRALNDETAA